MADILIQGLSEDLKRRIDRHASLHGNSRLEEIVRLIEYALKADEGVPAGLGTRLSQLISAADWDHNFIVERDKTDREPPDFGDRAS
jgi:plasmid stability protein